MTDCRGNTKLSGLAADVKSAAAEAAAGDEVFVCIPAETGGGSHVCGGPTNTRGVDVTGIRISATSE